MLGAIIGDIVGSVYEWHNIKTKTFPLFRDDCFFTDDTVMTVATAEALMNGGETEHFIAAYKKWGRLYPDMKYGLRFNRWIRSNDCEPYNSWGNGSAMRVSPCGWVVNCGFWARTGCFPVTGREVAKASAEVTHNHPEGIKGALAVVDAICYCRFYSERLAFEHLHLSTDPSGFVQSEPWTLPELKQQIRVNLERWYGYDLSRTLDEIRPAYQFNESCQQTVPQAIIAFLESTDFEDAIRNAISLGGDSDTLAAITGSIAEAAYGIPAWIKNKAWSYLDEPIRDVCRRWGCNLT